MSYRIWWLIAFCALGIGVAIEAEVPADTGAAEQSARAHVPPATVAATPAPAARKHS